MPRTSEDKWQALGFKRKPFIDLARHKPFLTVKQRQQLTLLEELVQEGGHLLLLLGVSGVGKTTFLHIFKKNMQQPKVGSAMGICELQGDIGVNVAMVKTVLAKHLAITDAVHTDTFIQSLQTRLAQLAERKERFLLIIDDAHELPVETVRFLLDLMAELEQTNHTLSILLAGRMQLEYVFASSVTSDLGTGSSLTIALEPYTEEEVVHYIKYGLRQAGYRGVMPFSKMQLIELARESKGIVARLLVMAVDLLETKRRVASPSRFNIINKKALIVVSVIVVAIAAVALWPHHEESSSSIVSDQVVSVEQQGAWVKTVTKPNIAAEDDSPVVDTENDTVEDDAVVTDNVNATSNVTEINSAATVNSSVVTANTPATQTEQSNNAIAVSNKMQVTPQTRSTQTAAVKTTQKPLRTTQKTPAKPATKTVPTKAPQSIATSSMQGYAVQIAAGSELQALQQTVCQLWTSEASVHCSDVPDNLHYIATVRNAAPWYIATLGPYADAASAHTALTQLPDSVQKHTPWVRPIAGIQELKLIQ